MQKQITLAPKNRGFHLVTSEITGQLPELKKIKTGICYIFIQHTSAGLTINENADPSVRRDFETFMNEVVPEDFRGFTHTLEGRDDMPAHIKSAFFGYSLQIPVTTGSLALGTWQGIYLCEHRNHGGARNLVVTISGE